MNNDTPAPANAVQLLTNPADIMAAFNRLNALSNPRIVLSTPPLAGGMSQLKIAGNTARLVLALQYPAGVPAALAGGATLADVITAVNKIIAGETAIQTNPAGT